MTPTVLLRLNVTRFSGDDGSRWYSVGFAEPSGKGAQVDFCPEDFSDADFRQFTVSFLDSLAEACAASAEGKAGD